MRLPSTEPALELAPVDLTLGKIAGSFNRMHAIRFARTTTTTRSGGPWRSFVL
jgi:hypothetical protein